VGWFGLVLVAALAAVFAWRLRWLAGRQRRLMLLCQRAGLDFAPLDPSGDTAWLPFPMFGRERSGTENVVWDRRQGTDVRAFDFWYREADDGRPVGGRWRLTCAVVPLPASCPRMRVAPRDLVDGAVGALFREGVRLELEAFTRRFHVETDDERFAVAFLDQRMMEAFLALPEEVAADVNGDVLLLSAPLLAPERVLRLLDAAAEIHRRIPRVISGLYPLRPHQGPHERRWLQGRWSPDPTGRS
jgi:hypothetical protein